MLSVCEQRRTAKVTQKWRKRASSCFTPLFCVSSRHQAAEQRSILSVCEQRRTAKVTQKWRKRASKRASAETNALDLIIRLFITRDTSFNGIIQQVLGSKASPYSQLTAPPVLFQCYSNTHNLLYQQIIYFTIIVCVRYADYTSSPLSARACSSGVVIVTVLPRIAITRQTIGMR